MRGRFDRPGENSPIRPYGPKKPESALPTPARITLSDWVRRLLFTSPFALLAAFWLGSLAGAGMEGLAFAHLILVVAWVVVSICAGVAESVTTLKLRQKIPLIIGSSVAVGIFCAATWKWEDRTYLEKITLTPANYHLTENTCDPSGKNYAVIMGTSVDVLSGFPADLITMDGRSLVQLALRDDSTISVAKLTLYDDRHDVIATVNNDVFWTRNDVRRVRPNPHLLLVYDHNDDLALSLYYLNDHVIDISGIFRNKSFPMIIHHGPKGNILLKGTTGPSIDISKSCMNDLRIEQTATTMKFGNVIVE